MLKFNDCLRVSIADYKVSKSPSGMTTLGLGSCVGICLYDINTKVGGLAHIMLPNSKDYNIPVRNDLKYADITIPKMIDDMISIGANIKNIRAVVVGGGNMFINSSISLESSIGYKNQVAVKSILKDLGIPIVCSDLGGNTGKTVYFCLKEGDVFVKKGLEVNLLYSGKKGG